MALTAAKAFGDLSRKTLISKASGVITKIDVTINRNMLAEDIIPKRRCCI